MSIYNIRVILLGGKALILELMHMSKLSHLTEILITLQYRELATAAELAEVLKVDKKTVYRYIDTLIDAKMPIHTKKGRHGGFYLADELFLKDIKLTEEEIIALLSASEILTKDNGFAYEHELKSAVTKIKNVSLKTDDNLRRISSPEKFKLKNIGDIGKLEDLMSKINYSMSKGRSLDILYYSATKASVTKGKIDPYNIIFRDGSWYLIAYSHLNNDVRMYVISRIKSLKRTEEIFIKPQGFSSGEFLDKQWGMFMGEKKHIKIKFSKKSAEYVKDIKWHPYQEVERLQNEEIVINFYLDEFSEIKQWILSFGAEAEVLEPIELRDEISEDIAKLYLNYKIKSK